MELLLVALVPVAGIAIMLVTALITAPSAVRSEMLAKGEASQHGAASPRSAA